MKIIFPLLSFLLLFSSASAQPSRAEADIQKKIADATPAALPQQPPDGRVGSDAKNAGLIGKVKSIATRYTDHTDRRYPKRMLTGEDFYNEAGDRVRSIDWDDIRPVGVTVYGYIDKMRVSRSGNVDYAGRHLRMVETLPADAAPKSSHPKPDPRYDIRWIYSYDSRGRLVEETHCSNTGEILTRSVYSYETENRRSVLHYAGGSEPIARVMEIIDPVHGHIVEEWLYDEDQKVNSIRQYSYKFDDRGNWIEQTVTERPPSGKSSSKPVGTTYRTIIYYR